MDMGDTLGLVIPIIMFLIPMVAVIGGFVYVTVKVVLRSRVRELEIRERIALIERGLVPPPEVDPGGFDRAMALHDRVTVRRRIHGRHRRAGVTMMGVGFGLMLLVASTADVSIGIGVGGFLVMIGLAFLLNSLFEGPAEVSMPSRVDPLPPPPPSSPVAAPPPEPRRD
jgi:hypothetical protein